MHIIELTAQNIKRIKAIKIKPQGNSVIIEGPNGAGKTSLMECICMALGGKRLIPDNPIRDGETHADIMIDLGEYKISRSFTQSGSYLKIENKDGMKPTNPQQMLDGLIGDLSFDPMSFCNMDKDKRLEILKKICNLDFSDLKKDYDKNYAERTILNRDIESLQIKLKDFENLEPCRPVRDVKAVENERNSILTHNKNIEDARNLREKLKYEISDIQAQIDTLNRELEDKKIQIVSFEDVSNQPLESTEHLKKEFDEILKQTTLSQKHAFMQSIEKDLQDTKTKREVCEDALTKAKSEKEKRLSDAKFPVNGMSMNATDIVYKGIEFSQLCSSEKIKISMAMAMSLNPKIKIIRIMNGSLLDNESMKNIQEIAKERDFQLWIERVSDKKDDNAVFIEDGEVKP